MGQFANTIFSMLLGWVQTAAAWLWQLMTNTDVSAWLRWLLDHWLLLLLALCAAGLVIDFVIYLIRWQPYRVWRSFLQGMQTRRDNPGDEEGQLMYQRKWVYADGRTALEDIRQPRQQDAGAATDHLELPIRPVRRVARHMPDEQTYYQPVYPPQWQQKTNDDQGGKE